MRNETFVSSFGITDTFVWVLGTEDTVVWPREGEWWGAMDPSDPWHTVQTRESRSEAFSVADRSSQPWSTCVYAPLTPHT